jgi:hypothetical protein
MERKIQRADLSLQLVHPNAAGVDIGNESHYVAVPPDRNSRITTINLDAGVANELCLSNYHGHYISHLCDLFIGLGGHLQLLQMSCIRTQATATSRASAPMSVPVLSIAACELADTLTRRS